MIIELNDKIISNFGSGTVIGLYDNEIQVRMINGDIRTITNNDIVALQHGNNYKFDMTMDTFPR